MLELNSEHLLRRVETSGRNFTLRSGRDEEFAILDTRSISRLAALNNVPSIQFEALVAVNEFSKRRRHGAKRKKSFPISINILGPQDTSSEVATRLSKVSGFLHHPKSLEMGIQYSNPQYFRLPGDDLDMNDFVGLGCSLSRARKAKVSEEISEILESLTAVEADHLSLPEGLLSQLKPYQEDGVQFILQRESEQGIRRWQNDLHRVTRFNVNEPCPPCYGGIIADAMGLGKTLTILTAILHSLPSADKYGMFYHDELPHSIGHTRTRATLVVVTSAQLLENWKSEIARHFAAGTLSAVIFHGPKRPSNKEDLTSASIVLTTYATVVADLGGLGVLGQMSWYRIVLDEAHWIKNSGSKQFRALSSLVTSRRWCVTGTPIQNRLDELASLASFLRQPPFPTKSAFQTSILGPLSQGGPDYAKPLRAYLRAYCLRRTETHLELPESSEEVVLLNLSSEEHNLYEGILEQSRREIDVVVSTVNNMKKYSILFTAFLRMRMLCNLGTLPSNQTSAYLCPQKDSARCERCSEISEDNAMLLESFSFCPDCSRPLQLSSPSSNFRLSPVLDYEMERETIRRETSSAVPHSSKLSAVVKNAANHGQGAKHIVFSNWTSTLNSLGQLFTIERVSYVQVDGRTSYAERSNRTGAVGLNLTVANVVHIVEPQWNPSVEEQAVARALRMGQTKHVKIFRYIMKGTIEENIIGIQKKKKKLATFTFCDDDGDDMQEKLEDLNSILNTNPEDGAVAFGATSSQPASELYHQPGSFST
ncbi:hypothetical protein FDECE_9283 [Fusarium decemcellulare]|nr:hypothetical protein FDECE_9283 [Fusarium decemcellulare]